MTWGQNFHGLGNTRPQTWPNHTYFTVNHMGVIGAFLQLTPICSTLLENPPM
jgi:hypothetical protein